MTGEPIAENALAGGFAASSAGWIFNGSLTFDDAADAFEGAQALALPASGIVDFSGLRNADSAALAVMIALKRRATAEGRTLTLTGLPATLRSLAVVYGIENLLAD